jgi:hypothetical protein
MSKWNSLVKGYALGQQIARDYEEGAERRELRKIADAKPEQSQGFTADQGDELRRAAESGQYDIGYDDASKAYTVTPKTDPTQTGRIAQQGLTDFMGQRQAGTMQPNDVENARQMAMAGVVARRDPMAAMRMRREVTQAQRDDQRFTREQKSWARQDKQDAKADDEEAFSKKLESEVSEYFGSRLKGADGKARPATPDDFLAATEHRISKLMEAGKVDQAEKAFRDHNAQAMVKIQRETAERDKALGETIAAVNAGNLEAARAFYDRFLPDGAAVSGFKQSGDGSIVAERVSSTGQPLQPLVFKDVNQLTASLSALKDPMAVYNYTQSEFRNAMAIKADQRADRAEGRAAASHGASMADRGRSRSDASARAEAGVALYRENNPNATPAQLEAVRQGILSAAPERPKAGSYKVEAGDVATLLGTPATDSRGNALTDPLTGRQIVNRNPDRERQLFEFMRDNQITDTNEALARFMAPPTQGARAGGAPYKDGTELRGKDGKTYVVKNGVPVPK